VVKVKRIVFRLIQPSDSKKDPNFIFDIFIIVLIILNVLAVIIASVPVLHEKYSSFFYRFELFSVIIFTVEYILRIWTCTEIEKYNGIRGRIKWFFSPLALIDLLAILPFYLPFIGVDLRFVRIFRLFRIFRLLKIARYTSALDLIRNVFKSRKEELFVTLVFAMLLLIVSSTLMYYAENEVQPNKFSSIPAAMWWAVITLTTVGYGDIYPITGFGKVMAGIIALLA